MYPMWLVWPLVGLRLRSWWFWVCWRASGERRPFPGCWPAAQQRCCRSSWPPGRDRPVALLIMVRPGHATYLWATHAAGFVPMGTRGAYRHDLAGVVSHIASLDRSDSLGNRCVVVACNFGAGNGLATACHVVLRFAGGDRSRRRRLIALLLRQRWAGSGVVALALGTVPGAVVLVLGGLRLRGVLDIANGAAVVFLFVLAG